MTTTITNDALRIMGKMSAGVADTLLQAVAIP